MQFRSESWMNKTLDLLSEDEAFPDVSFSELIPAPKKSVTNSTRGRRTATNSRSILLKCYLSPHSKLKSSGKCENNENPELQKKKPPAAEFETIKNTQSKYLSEKSVHSSARVNKILKYSRLGTNPNKTAGTAHYVKKMLLET